MSHITELRANIKFTDETVLREALKTMGKVLEGSRAKTLILNDPGAINNLQFLEKSGEWIARADNWGLEAEYKTLINKVQTSYQLHAINKVFKKNRFITTFHGTNLISGRRF